MTEQLLQSIARSVFVIMLCVLAWTITTTGAYLYVGYKAVQAREELVTAYVEECMRTTNKAKVLSPEAHMRVCRLEANEKVRGR
jgi:hypothetical protein